MLFLKNFKNKELKLFVAFAFPFPFPIPKPHSAEVKGDAYQFSVYENICQTLNDSSHARKCLLHCLPFHSPSSSPITPLLAASPKTSITCVMHRTNEK